MARTSGQCGGSRTPGNNRTEFIRSSGESAIEISDDWDFGILYERTRAYTETNQADKAIGTAKELIEQRSEFVPGYNYLALAYMANDQYEDAIATLQSALKDHPKSILLRSNLVRFLCLRGNFSDAAPHKEHLIADTSTDLNDLTRKAEALAYLDDMANLVNLLESIPPDPQKDNRPLVQDFFII